MLVKVILVMIVKKIVVSRTDRNLRALRPRKKCSKTHSSTFFFSHLTNATKKRLSTDHLKEAMILGKYQDRNILRTLIIQRDYSYYSDVFLFFFTCTLSLSRTYFHRCNFAAKN